MKYSEQIKELAAALCKAQSVLAGADKNKENTHLRSKYADLNSCWEAVRGPLTSNGLSVVQPFATDNGRVTVTTLLMHTSGQWISMEAGLAPKSNAPADLGTVVSYLRRYSLAAMTGLSQADDEGPDTSEDRPEPPQKPAKASGSIGSPEGINEGPLNKKQDGYILEFHRSVTAILHDPDAPDEMRAAALLDVRNEMNEDKAVFTGVWRKLTKAEQETFKALLALAEKKA
jgi:hypothetical protein